MEIINIILLFVLVVVSVASLLFAGFVAVEPYRAHNRVKCKVTASDAVRKFAKEQGIEKELDAVISFYSGRPANKFNLIETSNISPLFYRFKRVAKDEFAVTVTWH